MATFVGAVSVGLAVLTDTRSSSHHDLQWQQWKHDFSELQQTLEMSERIRLSNERIQPLLDSLTADRLLRQQESRWAPRTTVHDSRLVIEPPPPVVLEVPLPEAALIEGQRREVQFPEVQLPDLEQLDQLKVDPRDLERLLETPSRTRSPATFNE